MSEVDDFLAHYGVPGMKWGKRKSNPVKSGTESMSTVLKDGTTLTLRGERTPALAKAISRLSPTMRNRINNSSSYQIVSPDGNVAGELSLRKMSPTELNVIWVGVNESHRGKGYASAAMKASVDFAKAQKLDKVTLEVPGDAPDARHIYEKMGFVAGKQITKDDAWGGLTEMTLDLKKRR